MNMTADYSHLHTQDRANQAMCDYEVCKAVLGGNTQAFAILASKYQKRVYMLGLSFFDNTDDCEDFVQESIRSSWNISRGSSFCNMADAYCV